MVLGRFFLFTFPSSLCSAEPPAQCRAKVRIKRRYVKRRTAAFSSLFSFALPTPSSAQSRGATGVPCSRVTLYRDMYRPVCNLFCVCCSFSTLCFRLDTYPPHGVVGAATFHPGYLLFLCLNPRHADGEFFLHDFSLVLAPVFLSTSTRAGLAMVPLRLAIVRLLWLVCRIAFPAPPATPAVCGRF